MLGTVLIGTLIIVTFLSLFVASNNSEKGFFNMSILGVLLAVVILLALSDLI
jgi:hypothetical protein